MPGNIDLDWWTINKTTEMSEIMKKFNSSMSCASMQLLWYHTNDSEILVIAEFFQLRL